MSMGADDAAVSAMDDRALLSGELATPPRSWWATTLRGITGYALLLGLWRGTARLTLGYKKPASLALGQRGLELNHRTEMMGRTLAEHSVLVPLANLASVTREVRYARAGLYAGLAALAIGTYVGVGLFVDGLRVSSGSVSLVGLGAAIVVLGLALDFAFLSAFDSSRSKCRVVVRQRAGKAIVLAGVDRAVADAFLEGVAETAGYELNVAAPSAPSDAPPSVPGPTLDAPSPPRVDGTPPPP